MPFKEYRQIVTKINGLDKPLSLLTKTERNDVLNLSIRQEELEKKIGEQTRKSFRELQDGLDVVAEWVTLMQEDAIKALGVDGTPEEVLALEETLAQAYSLNTQISSLTLANYTITKNISDKSEPVIIDEPAPEPIKIAKTNKPKLNSIVPLLQPNIDMMESCSKKNVVTKVLEELNESVTAAAPAMQPEVFNQPRITPQKTRPVKRKKR